MDPDVSSESENENDLSNFIYSEAKMLRAFSMYTVSEFLPFNFGENIRFVNFIRTIQPSIYHLKYSHAKTKNALVRYIASLDLPLTTGENFAFINFIKTIQPAFSRVSRETVVSELLSVFDAMKKELIAELSSFNGVISITCDLWTGVDELNYVCVGAHFVDSNWMMQKRTIAFRWVDSPYDGDQVYEFMMEIFREFGIVDKISCITLDNHIADDVMFDKFKLHLHPPHCDQLFHMECLSDTINLIVRDGLNLIEDHMKRIRHAVYYISSYHGQRQEFHTLCKSYGLKHRKLKSGLENRWDFTYQMLQSCVNYDKVISEFYNRNHDDDLLCEKDWEICFAFMEILGYFYDAMNVCAKVYYPTSCLVLDLFLDISCAFSEYRDHVLLKDICNKMEERFKKYWDCIPPILCLAAVMDPRTKLGGVESRLDEISGNLSMPLPINAKDVKILLSSLYNAYESKLVIDIRNTSLPFPLRSKDYYSWSVIGNKVKRKTFRNELDKYFETDYSEEIEEEESFDFDILAWWKAHERVFPVLSIMARDLLTPPVSTIVSEYVFCADSRVLDQERSMLDANILECLVCIKDWENARIRGQNWTDEEIADYDLEEEIDDDDDDEEEEVEEEIDDDEENVVDYFSDLDISNDG